MNPISFKPIIKSLIATTLALSSASAMETTTTTTNPEGLALTNPMQQPFEITIGGETLNSSDISANLDHMLLTTVPAEIGNFSALKYLWLHRNQLITVPAEIGKLSALEYLNLQDNQLTTIPAEIGNLTALVTLSLNNNQLTTVPAEIGKLSALEYLNLEGNPLVGPESKWAKELQGEELKECLMFYTKKDLEPKTMLMLLANQLDADSSLADLLPELVRLICSTHIDSRLG